MYPFAESYPNSRIHRLGVAIVPSLATRNRPDVAARVLRQPAPLVALSLLIHEDTEPIVKHFLTTITQVLSTPTELLTRTG